MARTIQQMADRKRTDAMHERLALAQMPSKAAETVLLKLGWRKPYQPGNWWTLKASTVTADDAEWMLFKAAASKMLDEAESTARRQQQGQANG